jgi:phosphoribosylamine--glycine ligase
MKVLLIDTYGDSLDLALRAQACGHEVVQYISPSERKYELVGKGLVKRTGDFTAHLKGADLTVVCDNVKNLVVLDRFRADNPKAAVFGPNVEGARWEIDRLVGMKVLEKHGIDCPPIQLCSTYEQAVAHVKKRDTRLVCKPCYEADKCLSYRSKGPEDMLFMLAKWKQEGHMSKGQFVLQDFIPGVEFAVGGYMGRDGFAGGWEENFEFKKLMPGDIGPNTGEMGTVLQIVKKSKLAAQVLMPLERALLEIGYTGDVDVNCIIDEKGNPWPLEFTMRMGYPALQIQTALFPDDPVAWMYDLATGRAEPEFKQNTVSLGVAVCMSPFPYDHAPGALACDFPVYGVTPYNRDKLHPYHIQKGKTSEWATAGLYALIVTGTSDTVSGAAENTYRTLKQLVIPGSPIYREDIGKKLSSALPRLQGFGYAQQFRY